MSATPRVSVLMTSYNREKTIAAAIESVLVQRFTDFELVIVDNCSTDESLAVARRYEQRDARVRVFLNERNLGQFGNRARALEHARSSYVKYHDSDDVMYPHCLEVLVACLDGAPSDVPFALSTGWNWLGGPCPMLLTPELSYTREFLGHGMFNQGPASALFRTEFLRAVGGFKDYGAPSDYVFWLEHLARVKVVLAPGDLFWYRQHEGQELLSPRSAGEYAKVAGMAWAALTSPDCPLKGEALEQAKRNFMWGFTKSTYRSARRGNFSLARTYMKSVPFGLLTWMQYFRRQRRSEMAGTPKDADGNFIIPRWVRLS